MRIQNYEVLFAKAAEISMQTLHCTKGEIDTSKTLVVLLLERTHNIFLTIGSLIPSYVKDKRHEYSMGLILRTGLLDLLVTLNIHEIYCKSNKIEKDLDEFAFDILGDGFAYVLKLIDEENKIKLVTDDQYEEFKKNIVNQYPDFFEKYDGHTPKLLRQFVEKRAQPYNLYKTLKLSQPKSYFYPQVYGQYSLYSKYEHINHLYHSITRNQALMDDRLAFCFDRMLIQAMVLHEILKTQFSNLNTISINTEKMKDIVSSLDKLSQNINWISSN
jgi:hypothetical protein